MMLVIVWVVGLLLTWIVFFGGDEVLTNVSRRLIGKEPIDFYDEDDAQDVLIELARAPMKQIESQPLLMPAEYQGTYRQTKMYELEKAWDKEHLTEAEFWDRYPEEKPTPIVFDEPRHIIPDLTIDVLRAEYDALRTEHDALRAEFLVSSNNHIHMATSARYTAHDYPVRSTMGSINPDETATYEINVPERMTHDQFVETMRTVFEDLAKLVSVPGPSIVVPKMAYKKPHTLKNMGWSDDPFLPVHDYDDWRDDEWD